MLPAVIDEDRMSVDGDNLEELEDGTVALLDDTGDVIGVSPLEALQ